MPRARQDQRRHVARCEVIDVDNEIGYLCIERRAHDAEGRDGGARILVEERPARSVAHPGDQRLGTGPQPHHGARGRKQCPIGRCEHRAPATETTTLSSRRQATWRARASASRNACSPSLANSSGTLRPVSASTSASESRYAQPRRSARQPPTVVLPAPIIPTSKMRAVTGPVEPYFAAGRVPMKGSRPTRPGSRLGCARPRRSSRPRTYARLLTPARGPSWSRPPRPWPAPR